MPIQSIAKYIVGISEHAERSVLPKMKNRRDQITMANHNIATSIEKNSRILVADDYEANQKIAQLILQKAGYHVDVVENGQQAVETCQQNHYDLILMDIQMPIMDGLKATEEIRKWENGIANSECGMRNKVGIKSDSKSEIRNPKSEIEGVPIIAMTGSAAEGSFDEKHYPGMNDCIGKPMQRDRLLSVVQKWINAESTTQTNEDPKDEAPLTIRRPEEKQFPLNLDRAIQEFMGQKEILFSVLLEFVNIAGTQIDTIRQAVKGVDYGVIVSEAHAIKGGAANLTADKLARFASDLEKAAEARQPNLIGQLADKLEQEFYCLAKYIQQNPELRKP
jgi:CheY-like chemotaxis protein/HPt (histidine-containing phosphotransfer) domain-containing protein